MGVIKWYGASARNTSTDSENTVAYQSLCKQMEYIGGSQNDVEIDIVRTDSPFRPKLQHLIDTLGPGDRIDLNSIDTFIQGDNRKAVDYYSAIIKKGITLLIYDFTGAIAKISPYSNVSFGNTEKGEPFFIRSEISDECLIARFTEYYNQSKDKSTTTAIKTAERIELSIAFREIYFAYESYQIDQPTMLALMEECCGLKNKRTFWAMCKDFENALDYDFELNNYAIGTPEILELPKRCGGVPQEYTDILNYAAALSGNLSEEQRINLAMEKLGMVGGYSVFRRWELLANGTKKPRKPVVLDFNIAEFRKEHCK